MDRQLEPATQGEKLTVRILGFQPGASQEELVKLLSKLYRSKDPEKIRMALAKVPITLTKSATEDQARRIRKALEERGAIVEITYTGVLRAADLKEEKEGKPVEEARKEQEIPVGGPVTWVKDRRSRPRIHPGLPLEPMSIKEMLLRCVSILKENFSVLFLILLIPTGVAYLVSETVESLIFGGLKGGSIPESLGNVILVGIVRAAVLFLLFYWGEGALIVAISEIHLGHAVSLKESYRLVRPKLGGLITTMLLSWLLILLGTILFFVPGYVMFFRFLLADKVVVLEGLKGREALRRSGELMRSRFGDGLTRRPWIRAGVALTAGLLVAVAIYLGFTGVALGFGLFLPKDAAEVVGEALGLMAEVLSTIFVSTLMVLYYYDIRVRKEGLDYKIMAKSL